MANSYYDYHKELEKEMDPKFIRNAYIIIRVDGHRFHTFCSEHNFHKPNDKRALDLMVEAAKHVMKQYVDHICLAYGHSDEFSFVIKNTSNLMSRRKYKITSMIPCVFATYYNSNWDKFFADETLGEPTRRKYDAWFDAKPMEYVNYRKVIDYFKWRQVDCHINNLYNTTLHALTGRYVKHELLPVDPLENISSEKLFNEAKGDDKLYRLKRTPISDWISDTSLFFSSRDATSKLSGTESSDKHEIMFKQYKINYNNELEQFKKGTIIVNTSSSCTSETPDANSIKLYHVDIVSKNSKFWAQYLHIFPDYLETSQA